MDVYDVVSPSSGGGVSLSPVSMPNCSENGVVDGDTITGSLVDPIKTSVVAYIGTAAIEMHLQPVFSRRHEGCLGAVPLDFVGGGMTIGTQQISDQAKALSVGRAVLIDPSFQYSKHTN